MIAGLPGTGLGGIFYLIAALWVIARGLLRAARERNPLPTLRGIARLVFMTAGILVAIWGTYWILGELFAVSPISAETGADSSTIAAQPGLTLPAIFLATLPIQLATILLLLGSVEFLRWFTYRHSGSESLTPRSVELIDGSTASNHPRDLTQSPLDRTRRRSRLGVATRKAEVPQPQTVGHDKDA